MMKKLRPDNSRSIYSWAHVRRRDLWSYIKVHKQMVDNIITDPEIEIFDHNMRKYETALDNYNKLNDSDSNNEEDLLVDRISYV